MSQHRRAVIDLGTNTFHILIADLTDSSIVEVYRERRFVKLASEGIATIGTEPFLRGLDALQHYAEVLREYHCSDVLAFGTAALRTASNGPEFVTKALEVAGIQIKLIPGDEEARLITQGVLAAIPPLEDRILIMDIGGGSTEYIIADESGVQYRESFPIGVSVLKNDFHHSDPITSQEVETLWRYLTTVTAPLAEALKKSPTTHLVGAAGTFDVLAEVMRDDSAPPHPTSHRLYLKGFPALYRDLVSMDLAERLTVPGIPPERADMIVVAFILLKFTFKLAGIDKITVSDYAMKEGILLDRPG